MTDGELVSQSYEAGYKVCLEFLAEQKFLPQNFLRLYNSIADTTEPRTTLESTTAMLASFESIVAINRRREVPYKHPWS